MRESTSSMLRTSPFALCTSQRLRVVVWGVVQGVGFRPFVHRLATGLGLAGWVCNTGDGVTIEVEGARAALDAFLVRLAPEQPPRAAIQSLEPSWLDPAGYDAFTIRPSTGGPKTASILPDVATCPACLAEVFDPRDRRYRYPFTNCTHCGPRFSIVEALPYDRPNTSMRRFAMCPACRAEYEDVRDRRFHAQPNACPACGPQLALWDPAGRVLATRDDALGAAAGALRAGAVVAVKGLGGFHLMVDARSTVAVARLRRRKHREEKPFAVMFPGLASVEAACRVGPLERRLLEAPEAPIVLLVRRGGAGDPLVGNEAVAPGNPYLGAMLPYTPLHHLMLDALGFPVVATSGNRSEEPICTDEHEALERLAGVADLFLVHDRPIVRPVDDAVVRLVGGRELVLRRARGYAPLPVDVSALVPEAALPSVLAVGAHLKNTVALSVGRQVFVGPHVGDLETVPAQRAFVQAAADLTALYDGGPAAVACDLHPDYVSTQHARAYARQRGLPVTAVQHHHAHVLACMAENHVSPPVLGVAWDGTGYAPDGTVWGGEFLHVAAGGFVRFAHLYPFPLPGGEQAVREPRRAALGLCYTCRGDALFDAPDSFSNDAFTTAERRVLRQMLRRRVNTPTTTSAGRLFDGVAALAGLGYRSGFEGQAALALECAATRAEADAVLPPYPFAVAPPAAPGAPHVVDWRPMVEVVVRDRAAVPASVVAARFHRTLAEMIAAVARAAGLPRVVLTGGCFQNRLLTEHAVACLERDGLRPYRHQRIPPGDGGISLGQAVAALMEVRTTKVEARSVEVAAPVP